MSVECQLPTLDELREAVTIYCREAYGSAAAEIPPRFSLEGAEDSAAYLLSDRAERTPDTANLEEVRSFALRLGNSLYPNMKLRISRPPKDRVYVFSVDCHDEMLKAPPGSADCEALEQLKRHNATVAEAILVAWDRAGLLTERAYLRNKIAEARQRSDLDT